MNLSLHLSAETEASLIEQAAREGQPPEVVAINAIREKLAEVTSHLADEAPRSPDERLTAPVDEQTLEAAKQIVQELGFRVFDTEVECDPDDPDTTFVLLSVEAPSTMVDTMEARRQWHKRLDALLGVDHSGVRLCVFPAPT